MSFSSGGSDLQELEETFLFPSFTVFETTTCLFAYYSSSGNAFCRECLLSSAFTRCSILFKLTDTFCWVRVGCCTASQQKQSRKQTPYSLSHCFNFLSSVR